MLGRGSLLFVYIGGVLFTLCTVYLQLSHNVLSVNHGIWSEVMYFTNTSLFDEMTGDHIDSDVPINLAILIIEIIVLNLTVFFLKKLKYLYSRDHIDELLNESKDTLRQTNEFIEKWRLRRINWQEPKEYSYLDEEPQEIKPLKLEVPILHMAIIDTLGTTRSKPERGDAGDTVNITDSTLLSVTSLFGEDMESVTDATVEDEKIAEELKNSKLRYRYL